MTKTKKSWVMTTHPNFSFNQIIFFSFFSACSSCYLIKETKVFIFELIICDVTIFSKPNFNTMLRVGFERRTLACESRALTYRAPMLGKEEKGCGTDLYHLYMKKKIWEIRSRHSQCKLVMMALFRNNNKLFVDKKKQKAWLLPEAIPPIYS